MGDVWIKGEVFVKQDSKKFKAFFLALIIDSVGAQDYDYAMSILHNDYRVNKHWSEHVDIFPVRLVPTFH